MQIFLICLTEQRGPEFTCEVLRSSFSTQAIERLKSNHQEIIVFNYNTLLSSHFLPKYPRKNNFKSTYLDTIAVLRPVSILASLPVHSPPSSTPPWQKGPGQKQRSKNLILSDLEVRLKEIRCFAKISKETRIRTKNFKLLISELYDNLHIFSALGYNMKKLLPNIIRKFTEVSN